MFESGMNFSRRGLVILRNCAGREGETNPYPDFISLNLNRRCDENHPSKIDWLLFLR